MAEITLSVGASPVAIAVSAAQCAAGVAGSSTFAGLTDKVSATIATTNTSVSDALALKAPLADPTFTGTLTCGLVFSQGAGGTFTSGAVNVNLTAPNVWRDALGLGGASAVTFGGLTVTGNVLGGTRFAITHSSLRTASGLPIGFSGDASDPGGVAADTAFSRKTGTPGTIRVGNGTANDASGNIELANLTASGTVKTGSQTAAAAIATSHATAVAAGVGAQTFISDTGKPAWAHGSPAVWKYADGTTVT